MGKLKDIIQNIIWAYKYSSEVKTIIFLLMFFALCMLSSCSSARIIETHTTDTITIHKTDTIRDTRVNYINNTTYVRDSFYTYVDSGVRVEKEYHKIFIKEESKDSINYYKAVTDSIARIKNKTEYITKVKKETDYSGWITASILMIVLFFMIRRISS